MSVSTVGDLTPDHIGWEISVADENPVVARRRFVLAGHRAWTYEGRVRVGLLDKAGAYGNVIGTERHYDADTPCELLRQVYRPRAKKAHRDRPVVGVPAASEHAA